MTGAQRFAKYAAKMSEENHEQWCLKMREKKANYRARMSEQQRRRPWGWRTRRGKRPRGRQPRWPRTSSQWRCTRPNLPCRRPRLKPSGRCPPTLREPMRWSKAWREGWRRLWGRGRWWTTSWPETLLLNEVSWRRRWSTSTINLMWATLALVFVLISFAKSFFGGNNSMLRKNSCCPSSPWKGSAKCWALPKKKKLFYFSLVTDTWLR